MNKKFFIGVIAAFAVGSLFLAGCKDDASNPFTGIKLSVSSSVVAPGKTIEITATYVKEDTADASANITLSLSADSTGGAYFDTAGTTTKNVTSGGPATLTLGGTASEYVTVTATYADANASVTVGTTTVIGGDDTPIGYAGQGWTPFYNKTKVVTVSTKEGLTNYANQGGYTIFVDGMIDMSDGMLPSTGGEATSVLDAFVAAKSEYKTYNEWKTVYGKASLNSDTSSNLNGEYGKKIRLIVKSKTAIIGKTATSGIKGGSIYLSGVSNVILRNLTIRDGYDPFPNHENGDGWNAQQDNIAIRNSHYVWVDHCTLEDTMSLATAPNGEKWQTYDGLCDITLSSSFVTVSNCILRNHDKTMLIGSGSSDISGGKITLCNNHYQNCGQRLPMTTYSENHIFNNYYTYSSMYFSQQAAIVARYGAYSIIAENNNFGSGIKSAFKASSQASGTCYASGNNTTSGTLSFTSTKPFDVPYTYKLISYEEVPAFIEKNAGAGKVTVITN